MYKRQGYKVDEDGEPVGGAIFGLFKENETEFIVENAVLTAESDAEGVFLFEDIRFGKWIVKELQPATGFVANDTPVSYTHLFRRTIPIPGHENGRARSVRRTTVWLRSMQ